MLTPRDTQLTMANKSRNNRNDSKIFIEEFSSNLEGVSYTAII